MCKLLNVQMRGGISSSITASQNQKKETPLAPRRIYAFADLRIYKSENPKSENPKSSTPQSAP